MSSSGTGIREKLHFGFGRRVPIILQAEAAECGMACLAMILGFYGRRVEMSDLRRQHAVSLKGMTLKHLIKMSDQLHLNARALRVELSSLSRLHMPSILHWGLNHYVVLESIKGSKIVIHDPAFGRRHITFAEASREFTGIALELTPTSEFVPAKARRSFRLSDLLRNTVGLGPALVQILILSLAIEVVTILMPIGAQIVIDEVVVNADHDLLIVVAAGLALLLVVQVTLSTARSWAIMLVSGKISYQWSGSLFNHLSRLPLGWFEKRHAGDVITRFGAMETIQKTLTTDLVQTVLDGIMSILMLAMLIAYGGWLALVVVVSTFLNGALHVFAFNSYRESSEQSINAEARLQTHFIETIRGIATVKLLNLRERRYLTWMNEFIVAINAKLRLQRTDVIFGRGRELLFGADHIILLVLGARAIIGGSMSLGMLVAFLAYRDQLTSRVGNLIQSAFQIRMLSVQTDRLADIVLAEPEAYAEESSTTNKEIVPFGSGVTGASLQADGLSIRYGENEPWVFRDLNLEIPAGASFAIIGPSGCGKTTLIKVLMGLLQPTEGTVYFDSQNINFCGGVYRSKIAGVLQDDGLFAGSIAQNISCFDENPDYEWVQECARRAVLLDDVRRMPMGFETLVGDMGSALSGGQKQRVILARALYQRPQILFLDEATSHLDEATESRVAEALNEMCVTRIIIAHRKTTVARSDHVLSLH